MVMEVPGSIVECGVFKGASLSYFAMLREIFQSTKSREIIGFDVFGTFPDTGYEADKPFRQHFIDMAGEESISIDRMYSVLEHKGCGKDVTLVKGDICQTVPQYVKDNPELKIAFLNLDTDMYEPAKVILEHFWSRIVPGGVLILDDYEVFPGETKAVNEFFCDNPPEIRRFPFRETPYYIIKE